jgi:hypothetical protein
MRGIQQEIVDDPSQRCAVPRGMTRQSDGCSGVLCDDPEFSHKIGATMLDCALPLAAIISRI